jgi:hypothetical protein
MEWELSGFPNRTYHQQEADGGEQFKIVDGNMRNSIEDIVKVQPCKETCFGTLDIAYCERKQKDPQKKRTVGNSVDQKRFGGGAGRTRLASSERIQDRPACSRASRWQS